MAAFLLYRTATPLVPTSTSTKGSPLSNEEIDGNFKSLLDDLASVWSANSTTNGNLSTLSGTVTALSGTVTTLSGTVSTNTSNISSLNSTVQTHTSDISNLQSSVSTLNSSTVTLTGIQTITNKTLTSPTINSPTINGFSGNTDAIVIGTNQFVKDTSGNIGLGTATPSWKLDVHGTAPGLRLKDGSNTSGVVLSQAASGLVSLNVIDNKDLIFGTNNTERMRVTSTGQVGIGKTPSANLDYRESVYVIATDTTVVQQRTYVLTASANITLPLSPTQGDWVKIINNSDTVTPTLVRNGSNIMGIAEDLTVNVKNANLLLTYADATRGWVIT